MAVTVQLEMSAELRSKLSTIAAALGGEALNAPLLAAGWLIANDAKGRAPYKSGTLRRSIEPQAVAPGEVIVGSSVPYARRLEYGFMQADRLGRHYNQAARPYLRPAFDANKAAARAAIIAGANAVIRRALGA